MKQILYALKTSVETFKQQKKFSLPQKNLRRSPKKEAKQRKGYNVVIYEKKRNEIKRGQLRKNFFIFLKKVV